MTRFPARALIGLGAGLLAGGFVGVAEVVALAAQAGRTDVLTALTYAVLVYGLLGAILGLAPGVGLLLARWPRRATGWSVALGLVCATLLAPIAFYHTRSALVGGAAALAGLLLAGGAWRLTRWPRGRWLARPGGSLVAYAALVLLSVVVGAVAGAVAGWSPARDAPVPPTRPDQPNVILIVADALRADHLSCYSEAAPATPHIDALAGDGVRYRRMSAQASWTKPSVATMLTSLYPSSHQAANADSQLPAEAVTLAEMLREQGYQTAGVVTNAYITAEFGFDQGFDSYVYLEPADPFLAPAAATRLAVYRALLWAYRQLDVGRWQRQTFGTWPGPYYQEAAAVNRAVLPWLAAHRGGRFFLYVHYMDPHTPYFQHPYDGVAFMDALPPDQAPWVKGLYDGEVAYLDAHLGALFDELKALGLYDDALIVFTADHGEEFFEHGGWGHGATLYEEQLRVPLIVKYPGGAGAGTVDEGVARSLDIAPTVLDVASAPVPPSMQGVSLRPGPGAPPRATLLLAETTYQARYPMRAVQVGDDKLIRTAPGHPRLTPPTLVFDLAADPGEHHDLSAAAPGLVQTLQAELDRLLAYAQARAVAAPQAGTIDPATQERLRNLGY